jgi:hypothetical protein
MVPNMVSTVPSVAPPFPDASPDGVSSGDDEQPERTRRAAESTAAPAVARDAERGMTDLSVREQGSKIR